MDFILGALLTAFFFCCLYVAYQQGRVTAAKEMEAVRPIGEDDFELEEQRKKAKKLKKGFDEMMSYNEAKARKG